jgi:hypothetical protein
MAEAKEARNRRWLRRHSKRYSTSVNKWRNERVQMARAEVAFDSELADDLHEVVHFSVHGRFADF